MRKILYLVYMVPVSMVLLLLSTGSEAAATDEADLIVTGLIKKGEVDKAKSAALDNIKFDLIDMKGQPKPVTSYSGYFTINETFDSNLFFWYFPALENTDKAPVILWMNELPGYSCLRQVLLENGPYLINKENKMEFRPTTWVQTHSILYLDAPVGSGFSYTKDKKGFANTAEDVAQETFLALEQFFLLFPELLTRDFFIGGENYAATVVPHLVRLIDNSPLHQRIKLKGVIFGSAWNNPATQSHIADYVYSLGLIDEDQKAEMKKQEDIIQEVLPKGKFMEGLAAAAKLLLNKDSLFKKYTGFKDYSSILRSKPSEELVRFSNFLNTKAAHKYLHVGLHKFELVSSEAFGHLAGQYMQVDMKLLEELLDKNYKVLIYAAQFDPYIVHLGVNNMVHELKWKGAQEFSKAKRVIWEVEDDIAGYSKSAQNFDFSFVRNAGKYAIMDQPAWMYDLIRRFTSKA